MNVYQNFVFNVIGTENMRDAFINGSSLALQNGLLPLNFDLFEEKLKERLDMTEFGEDYAKILETQFTEEEIEEVSNFASTEVGKRYFGLSSSKEFMKKTSEMGQRFAPVVMQAPQETLVETAQKAIAGETS